MIAREINEEITQKASSPSKKESPSKKKKTIDKTEKNDNEKKIFTNKENKEIFLCFPANHFENDETSLPIGKRTRNRAISSSVINISGTVSEKNSVEKIEKKKKSKKDDKIGKKTKRKEKKLERKIKSKENRSILTNGKESKEKLDQFQIKKELEQHDSKTPKLKKRKKNK